MSAAASLAEPAPVVGPGAPPRAAAAVQTTFDDLGVPLSDITFVVVDLETTGGSPHDCGITEVGAVKVRGGEVLGEFQTLVNPGAPIPAFVAVLTGISDSMVATAPRINAVLPAFLEFAHGSVLVAHNAPFDVGFLKAACQRTEVAWPNHAVVDTARLARRALNRDEAPDCKLSTLARLFRARVTPSHRALEDARATVDVLHGLFERLGCFGVTTLDDVATFSSRVSPAQRRKRHLADAIPSLPGVYLFRDGRGRVLYVGKSTNLRARVRQYFTASETRSRMAEMVALAEEVVPVVCATPLEAEVRELRLIAEHRPGYNRRSRNPDRVLWVKLTTEHLPRLSLVRRVVDDGAAYLGPFTTSHAAQRAADALLEAVPLRQCNDRLSPKRGRSPCALAEIGRCGAPCDGQQSVVDYDELAARARAIIEGDPAPVVEAVRTRIAPLVDQGRYEDAAIHRDRLVALLRASQRGQRLRSLSAVPELVAARPAAESAWQLALIRYGRLAGSIQVPQGMSVWPQIDAMRALAEEVAAPLSPLPAGSIEEAERILAFLDADDARLVAIDGVWAMPAKGAAVWRTLVDAATSANEPMALASRRAG